MEYSWPDYLRGWWQCHATILQMLNSFDGSEMDGAKAKHEIYKLINRIDP